MANANYIPLAQTLSTQRELYSTGLHWVRQALCWVCQALRCVPKALRSVRQASRWLFRYQHVGIGNMKINERPQHEWFHVAVEYRL